MKKIVFLVLAMLILSFSQSYSQKHGNKNDIQTIFGNKKVSRGGFGAISLASQPDLFGRPVFFTGFRGGTVVNHWFSFGLGGYSLSSSVKRDIGWTGSDPRSMSLYMTYGGLYFEPTVLPKFPVHVSFPFLIGGGGAIYIDETYIWDGSGFGYKREDSDMFVVIEPGINLEINFIKSIRFGIGAQYRYVNDLVLTETDKDAFNGLSYTFTMKIGKF